MNVPSQALHDALVSAYRPWVIHLLEQLGVESDERLAGTMDQGEAWLGETLEELLGQPYASQRRGPLELFQRAMRFPTAVLVERGLDPVERDPGAERAIPGDIYDLCPASSAMISEEVWQTHLAWGASKAAAMRQA